MDSSVVVGCPTIAPAPGVGTGEDGGVLPITRVRIVGPSMEPTLRNGDWWVVRRTSRVAAGDAVLLRHPHRPHLTVVKRAVERREGGWWVLGDNLDLSEDSRAFGVVPEGCIVGRLWFRYGPLGRSLA